MADDKKKEVERKRSILESLVNTFGMGQAANSASPEKDKGAEETERQKTLRKLMNDF